MDTRRLPARAVTPAASEVQQVAYASSAQALIRPGTAGAPVTFHVPRGWQAGPPRPDLASASVPATGLGITHGVHGLHAPLTEREAAQALARLEQKRAESAAPARPAALRTPAAPNAFPVSTAAGVRDPNVPEACVRVWLPSRAPAAPGSAGNAGAVVALSSPSATAGVAPAAIRGKPEIDFQRPSWRLMRRGGVPLDPTFDAAVTSTLSWIRDGLVATGVAGARSGVSRAVGLADDIRKHGARRPGGPVDARVIREEYLEKMELYLLHPCCGAAGVRAFKAMLARLVPVRPDHDRMLLASETQRHGSPRLVTAVAETFSLFPDASSTKPGKTVATGSLIGAARVARRAAVERALRFGILRGLSPAAIERLVEFQSIWSRPIWQREVVEARYRYLYSLLQLPSDEMADTIVHLECIEACRMREPIVRGQEPLEGGNDLRQFQKLLWDALRARNYDGLGRVNQRLLDFNHEPREGAAAAAFAARRVEACGSGQLLLCRDRLVDATRKLASQAVRDQCIPRLKQALLDRDLDALRRQLRADRELLRIGPPLFERRAGAFHGPERWDEFRALSDPRQFEALLAFMEVLDQDWMGVRHTFTGEQARRYLGARVEPEDSALDHPARPELLRQALGADYIDAISSAPWLDPAARERLGRGLYRDVQSGAMRAPEGRHRGVLALWAEQFLEPGDRPGGAWSNREFMQWIVHGEGDDALYAPRYALDLAQNRDMARDLASREVFLQQVFTAAQIRAVQEGHLVEHIGLPLSELWRKAAIGVETEWAEAAYSLGRERAASEILASQLAWLYENVPIPDGLDQMQSRLALPLPAGARGRSRVIVLREKTCAQAFAMNPQAGLVRMPRLLTPEDRSAVVVRLLVPLADLDPVAWLRRFSREDLTPWKLDAVRAWARQPGVVPLPPRKLGAALTELIALFEERVASPLARCDLLCMVLRRTAGRIEMPQYIQAREAVLRWVPPAGRGVPQRDSKGSSSAPTALGTDAASAGRWLTSPDTFMVALHGVASDHERFTPVVHLLEAIRQAANPRAPSLFSRDFFEHERRLFVRQGRPWDRPELFNADLAERLAAIRDGGEILAVRAAPSKAQDATATASHGPGPGQ